jgi:hypothetical protein
LLKLVLPKPGQKVVTMSGAGLKKLEENYETERAKRPNLSFAAFISESALMELERRKILKQAQLISLVAFDDDRVILRDNKKRGRIFEVQFRQKKAWCLEDASGDCIHVGFALALPEVRIALSK